MSSIFEFDPHRIGGSGLISKGTSGEALGNRNLVYLADDGLWYLADSDAVATMSVIGITRQPISLGNNGEILRKGFIGLSTWTWTVGSEIYASTTTGALTQTPPTVGTLQVVGVCDPVTNMIWFDPSGMGVGAQGCAVLEGATAYMGFDECKEPYANYFLCDGTADDVQIQTAVDYVGVLGSGEILFERASFPGYDFTATVLVPYPILFKGTGSEGSYLRGSVVNDYMFEVQSARVVFKDLYFNGRSKTGYGILVTEGDYLHVENCNFYNFQTAIDVTCATDDSDQAVIIGNSFLTCDYRIRLRPVVGEWSNEWMILGNHFFTIVNTAVELATGVGVASDNKILSNIMTTMDMGVDIGSTNAYYTKIAFNHIENATTAGVNFSAACQTVHIIHNRIQTPTIVGAFGAGCQIYQNDGAADMTQQKGVATILNGNNSIVVAHGLGGTPTLVVVNGRHAEVESAYVDTIGAANFTIHKGGAGNVTANRDVGWYTEL